MMRWPVLSDFLAGELYAVALSMLDGSYYQQAKDDQIEYCGASSVYENWAGGGDGDG